MIKKILTLITLITITSISAQKANFGLKGGLNITNFSGDLKANSSKTGFNVGAFVAIKTSSQFIIQPELIYSTQGVTDSGSTFNLGYINIPVMFKYMPVDKVSLDFGPQLGFMTSADVTTTIPGSNTAITVDASKLFNSTDFGLNLGATLYATQKLGIGLRYNIGFTNIATQELKDIARYTANIKDAYGANRVFSVNVEYKF